MQDAEYLEIAANHYAKLKNWKADNYAYDWDNKSPALHVLFNQVASPEAAQYASPPLPGCPAAKPYP